MYSKDVLLTLEERVGIDGFVFVIMPAFNSEKYIIESIESVLAQTYEYFELVIANDAMHFGCATRNTAIRANW